MALREDHLARILRTVLPLLLTTSLLPALSACVAGAAESEDEEIGETGQAITAPPTATFGDVSTISQGYYDACAIRPDSTVTCWGRNIDGYTPASPSGTFSVIDSGGDGSCGIRTDGTIACWGTYWGFYSGPPSGTFSRIALGDRHGCGIRTDGTIACWGDNRWGQTQAPSGKFLGISSDYDTSCGIREDLTLACWGNDGSLYSFGLTTPPAGQYAQVTVGPWHACAIRLSDSGVTCWGMYGTAKSPSGTFTKISAGGGPGYDYDYDCGLRPDGTLACWSPRTGGFWSAPAGTYTQIATRYGACAAATDGHVNCFHNVYWPDPLQNQPAGLVAKTQVDTPPPVPVCTPISFSAGKGRVKDVDYASGAVPGETRHLERWGDSPILNGWTDDGDRQMVGDFMGLGHDQVMYVNRQEGGGKVMIADLSACDVAASVPYWESWGDSPLLSGWLDDGDLQMTGDFMGLGHDQVMYVNRDPAGGKVMIVDYAGGSVPGQARYWESWGDSPLLSGWLDAGDLQMTGDFMGLGHDQVMYVNRDPAGGKVMIVDYASGAAQVRYWESWGDSPLLSGWLDGADRQMVGDFMGLGHSQVMYFNRDPGGGRVMIVDYASGAVPGSVRYWESWGDSALLNGWTDDGDRQMVGDFMGLGHSQVMYVNRQQGGGKVMVVDYASGAVPGQARYLESWGQSSVLDGFLDDVDAQLVGDFTGVGHAEVRWYNRDGN